MAKPRLPSKSDFPSNLTLDIVPPSTGQPLNVLILLHGLGDTQLSFTNLGRQLKLPETACISLRGPNPIPPLFTGSDTPAFHWGDDVLVDEGKGEIDMDAGFTTISRILSEITGALKEKCNFPERTIHFLGFGQGGMAALHYVSSSPSPEFGGVISIGGRLPSSSSSSSSAGKSKTPVLLCGGNRSSQVTRSAVDSVKARFQDIEYVRWEKGDDGMPRNRDEMLPLMRFLARRLRSLRGVPDGSVEI